MHLQIHPPLRRLVFFADTGPLQNFACSKRIVRNSFRYSCARQKSEMDPVSTKPLSLLLANRLMLLF
jgi:hypothetical protein